MDELFMSTTVFLTEKFVKSCSKETLQSKLSKLRLVTGVHFSKANKSYALTGKWEQVDAAFEVLTHWLENPEHEPDFENVWDGKIAKLCNCEFLNDILLKLKQNDQSESESRTDLAEVRETDDAEEEAIALIEKEYPRLKEGLRLKKKNSNLKIARNNNSHIDIQSVKSVILSRHRRDVEQNSVLTEKSCKSTDTSDKEKDFQKAITSEDEVHNVDFSPPLTAAVDVKLNDVTTDTHIPELAVKNRGPKSKQSSAVPEIDNSEPRKETKQLDSRPQRKKISQEKVTTRKTNNVTAAEKVTTRKTNNVTDAGKKKKPGEKGYWSRVKRNDGNVAHECPECKVTLKSRKRYLEHLRRIHIKEYQCTVCERRFGYPTDLKRHKCPGAEKAKEMSNESEVDLKVSREKPVPESLEFKCLECNYATRFKKRLTSHVQRSHRKEVACDQCDKKFGFQKDLNKHKENIHNENVPLYFCDQCSKCYKNKQIFESHLKTHEVGYVKPYYTCEHCAKSFTTKYSLAAHLKSVHLGQKKVYLCQICGKKFSQRSSYKQHCNAHNGVKPYKCNICEKAFVYNKSLKEHKFMHDNIRRFQCTMCEKAFRQRTTLHIHMKIHKTVKDHVCSVCGRGFSQKQAMERHERIHTGVRPYTCLICKKSFGDTSTIRRHMVSLHQKNEYNWREDTLSTAKKRSDYYVYGGNGQNRVYKSKPARKGHPESSRKAAITSPKPVQAEPLSVQIQHQVLQPESSLVLNPVQNNLQEPKFDFVVNGIPDSSLNGVTDSESHNIPTFQNLQAGSSVYAMATSQPQHMQDQNQSSAVLSPVGAANNGYSQILDFSSLTFVATKIPQQTDKIENAQQIFQQPLQVPHQNTNMLQNATDLPLAAVSDGLKGGQAGTSNQVSADSSLSQAIASIWGFVGYPSYQAQGNLPQYQPPQNQSN